MARSVILGNGQLTVGLNEIGLVHDFYFPYVGLDNLTTARSMHHKIGVWVDGVFAWTDDPSWETTVDFSSEALIATVKMVSSQHQIEITSQDFVDHKANIFCRVMDVKNLGDTKKEVRIFMHQVFELSPDGRGDTAMYVPNDQYILDYKGRVCLLISGRNHATSDSFDQYAVGNYGIEGKQGTYKDAEDGVLSNNGVEHGGVDSVIRFSLEIEPKSSNTIDYWIVASGSQIQCEKIHRELKQGLDSRLLSNQLHWEDWLSTAKEGLRGLDENRRVLAQKSLLVIKAHSDVRGGIIASCDSSIYNYGRDYYSYVWPRDGAYAIWPLIRLGYTTEPKAFFKFCADIISEDGYMMHKYQPDRAIGSTWHPLIRDGHSELAIQEDETAILIIMLGEYLDYSNDTDFVREMYQKIVKNAADFISDHIDSQTGLPHASYDLWEEKFLTSTYTTATVYRALQVACDLAEVFKDKIASGGWKKTYTALLANRSVFSNPDRNGYRKGFLLQNDTTLEYDNTLDVSSFYAVMMFHYSEKSDNSELIDAVAEIENSLLNKTPSGGSPRYENDNYFKKSSSKTSNPWIISTLWIAQYYIRIGDIEKAEQLINWAEQHSLPSGVMPEQVDPANGSPVSVTPLVWSHAEYINTVLDLSQKLHK